MAVDGQLVFPPGFLWGCATAAHQVEGGNRNDWWQWEQQPGRIFQDHKHGLACDWWNGRYEEDFDRAASLYNNAQRISVEWSRIEPEAGKIDQWALDRYRQMVLALRERGMTPMITLHHFTNPIWLAERGGWLVADTPARFAAFAETVVKALGDLCRLWCTVNEPMVYATNSYLFGTWTPGKKQLGATRRAAYAMLEGHVRAYHAIKAIQPEGQIGFSAHIIGNKPAPPGTINALATRLVNRFFNHAFLDAFNTGSLRLSGGRAFRVPHAVGAVDWVGMQYYQEFRSGFHWKSPQTLFIRQGKPPDMPVGPRLWGGLNPGAIFERLQWLYKVLKKPIYVSEAGVPDADDTIRPGYMAQTLKGIWHACGFNIPVRGLFWWSLLDNFEWTEGYDPRYSFGLYKTNFETQERTLRRSGELYREVGAHNALSAEMVAEFAPEMTPKIFPGSPGADGVTLKRR